MTHDIIDNRNEKLVDHINRILPSTERAKFAVGYFFLSGFEPIQKNLQGVSELKLLIGNTTKIPYRPMLLPHLLKRLGCHQQRTLSQIALLSCVLLSSCSEQTESLEKSYCSGQLGIRASISPIRQMVSLRATIIFW